MEPSKEVYIDKYRVIKLIAEGGFGKAYLVEERGTKNINVMKSIKFRNESQKQQIIHEIEIHRDLYSPFIVDFVEGFEYQNDTWNIIMEFCEGGDVDDFLEDLKKMGAEIKR
ncbi:MAG: hypothetical protein EZS28_014917 [Streblomastix strix]|uniref:non-specific serine/threonine protein kinase n=1 Tax=Streblomastix strix TaxID=222440 RepID=A0A5J4W3U9_9EUKA|nr:MAG: hypothetical protein EZS28_014917 [Streblomastix strix]